MSVGKICNRATHLAGPEESAQAAALRMKAENVGTLVVIDADRRPVGILTDRDLAVRVVAPDLESRETRVGDVMTAHPRWIPEWTPIEDAVATMRGLGVRRLPVVDEREHLVGVLSIDDVLASMTDEMGDLCRIVGASHPGIGVPATRPSRSQRPAPTGAGLERASSDLEC